MALKFNNISKNSRNCLETVLKIMVFGTPCFFAVCPVNTTITDASEEALSFCPVYLVKAKRHKWQLKLHKCKLHFSTCFFVWTGLNHWHVVIYGKWNQILQHYIFQHHLCVHGSSRIPDNFRRTRSSANKLILQSHVMYNVFSL